MKGHVKYKADYKDFAKICNSIRGGNLYSGFIDITRCGIDLHYNFEIIYDAKHNRTHIWVYPLFADVNKYLDIARTMKGTIIRYDGFATTQDLTTSKFLSDNVFKF